MSERPTFDDLCACDGWSWPEGARVYHYFWSGFSLCGRWYRPEMAHPTPPSPTEACVACWNARYVTRRINRSRGPGERMVVDA